MSEPTSQARIVLTTTSDREEAVRLAHTLVEERLVACANIIPSIHSVYHWQGRIESSAESLLLLKTEDVRIPPLKVRLVELHSYQTPEFVVLTIESGSQAYLDWLHACLNENL